MCNFRGKCRHLPGGAVVAKWRRVFSCTLSASALLSVMLFSPAFGAEQNDAPKIVVSAPATNTVVISRDGEYTSKDDVAAYVRKFSGDMETIKEQALKLTEDILAEHDYKTFKVESKRGNKTFPMTSPVICDELGGHLLDTFPEFNPSYHQIPQTAYLRGFVGDMFSKKHIT